MEVEFTREQNGNYMLIHGTKQVDCYEMKVVECNEIAGLLPLTMQRVNNQSTYMYLITNRISLSEMYARKTPGGEEINAFLNSLKEVLAALGNYLLRPDGLLLEADNIFVDKNTKKVSFAYYENDGGDFFSNLKKLFEDCILQNVDHSDNEAVTLVYGTYKRLCSNNCSIQGLFEVEESEEEQYSVHTEAHVEPSILPERVKEEEEVQDRVKLYSVYAAMGLIAIVASYLLLACGIEALRIGKFPGAVYGILGLAAVVGEYFLYRWYRENKILFVKVVQKEQSIPYEQEHVRVEKPISTEPISADPVPTEEGTVVLSMEVGRGVPRLRWVEDNCTKEWPVYEDTVIGSSAAKADCVIHAPGVSRMHAKILCLPDRSGYFVKDLNSTNSTSVDGVTLNPFQLRSLVGQEKIMLGNVEVEFII